MTKHFASAFVSLLVATAGLTGTLVQSAPWVVAGALTLGAGIGEPLKAQEQGQGQVIVLADGKDQADVQAKLMAAIEAKKAEIIQQKAPRGVRVFFQVVDVRVWPTPEDPNVWKGKATLRWKIGSPFPTPRTPGNF